MPLDVSAIVKAELFATLLEAERKFVLAHSGILQLRHGARLFTAGQKADNFYMLLEGSVRVVHTAEDGKEEELAWFAPGDTIGDFDFARQALYDAKAEAVEDSVLIMFPSYGLTMDDIADEEPHAVSQILLGSVAMVTSRIKKTQRFILDNMSWIQELRRRAYEDPGTGLWKQVFLTDEINTILEAPSALIMLKPDRFKTLVDSRGYIAGDEGMIRIASVLQNTARRFGRGWPLRFKSNEVGLLLAGCSIAQAEEYAILVAQEIMDLEPVPPSGEIPAFPFSASISWSVWPESGYDWDVLFQGTYDLLMETWKEGGNRITHYNGRNYPGVSHGE